ncbi:trans-aconitate 2-methyltransferase [Paracoccus laeviglucosivorans]|uniref:Trans-aconitate 2-methyltransferase n=1 Tax=Paracoccus laeviglucosivorans TaxID=1197861 RepID=A0A521CLI8_9RHOB|nr:trans-aconitate 2-methyltransferase [Paracoccus laeviglucosivorans]SMO60288.1 trans-aconitate 2-methyltransferase [Paracoccus laeviglucosivorans]
MTTAWSAAQYLKFAGERTRPALDLLNRVPLDAPGKVMDLGCGPGNSTALLVERFGNAHITGLDSDADMIATARKALPDCHFQLETIEEWQPDQPVDLIYANASLQWIPDHTTLMPRLVSLLAPGGVLAVQMPDNLDEPPHQRLAELGRDPRWSDKLETARGARHTPLSPAQMHALLRPLCTGVDIWRTTYYHEMADINGVVEWFKGAALRPYLAALSAEEQTEFLDEYRRALAPSYPDLGAGVLLPFPRMFLIARR